MASRLDFLSDPVDGLDTDQFGNRIGFDDAARPDGKNCRQLSTGDGYEAAILGLKDFPEYAGVPSQLYGSDLISSQHNTKPNAEYFGPAVYGHDDGQHADADMHAMRGHRPFQLSGTASPADPIINIVAPDEMTQTYKQEAFPMYNAEGLPVESRLSEFEHTSANSHTDSDFLSNAHSTPMGTPSTGGFIVPPGTPRSVSSDFSPAGSPHTQDRLASPYEHDYDPFGEENLSPLVESGAFSEQGLDNDTNEFFATPEQNMEPAPFQPHQSRQSSHSSQHHSRQPSHSSQRSHSREPSHSQQPSLPSLPSLPQPTTQQQYQQQYQQFPPFQAYPEYTEQYAPYLENPEQNTMYIQAAPPQLNLPVDEFAAASRHAPGHSIRGGAPVPHQFLAPSDAQTLTVPRRKSRSHSDSRSLRERSAIIESLDQQPALLGQHFSGQRRNSSQNSESHSPSDVSSHSSPEMAFPAYNQLNIVPPDPLKFEGGQEGMHWPGPSGSSSTLLAVPAALRARSRSSPSEPTQDLKAAQMFSCELCGKRFTRAYNLRSHMRTHTDERPFACQHCGKAFARQHDRKRHEALHSGQKRFVCYGNTNGLKWGCHKRFARADALGRHFRTEAGKSCLRPLVTEIYANGSNRDAAPEGILFTGTSNNQVQLTFAVPEHEASANMPASEREDVTRRTVIITAVAEQLQEFLRDERFS